MKFTKVGYHQGGKLWQLETPYGKVFSGLSKRDCLQQFIEWWKENGRNYNL